MTEQRAIDLLKGILPKKVSYANLIGALNCYGDKFVYESPEPCAIEYAINSIQENTKLKAEIEQLKEELEQSCSGCKFEDFEVDMHPCRMCRNQYTSKYKSLKGQV